MLADDCMISKKKFDEIFKPVPRLTVDGIVIKENQVLLVERTVQPFLGYCALPGGFVEYNETVEHAVAREVVEETGLRTKILSLTGVYSKPHRDRRGHVVTVAFLLKKTGGKLRGSGETKNARFYDLNRLPRKIGFDHRMIIKDAIKLMKKQK